MTLAAPWALLLAIVVLAVAWLRYRQHRQQLEPGLLFSSVELLNDVPETVWSRSLWVLDALRIAALLAIVVALARPQMPGLAVPDTAQGIDIVVALDTSGSMQAADFQPRDRMAVAKRALKDFIQQRSRDRIGLVVFGGEAATWVPLTLDYRLLVQMLDEVEVDMLPQGTAIGDALGTAVNRLRQSDAKSRVVVLITDGDNTQGSVSPLQAASLAEELGIKIYTILIGRGGLVPFPAGNDLFGRPVFQKVSVPTDPKLLENIASATGGRAYVAKDSESLDRRLSEVLNALDKSRIESDLVIPPEAELFGWLVGLAVLLLSLELLLSQTKLRRFP